MKMNIKLTLCGLMLCSVAACQPAHSGEKDVRMAGHYFDILDSNNDGVVTKGEARIYADGEFKQADTNKDGVMTSEEFYKMKEYNMNIYNGERMDRARHSGHQH